MTDDMSNDTNELFATIAEFCLYVSFLLSLHASSFPSPKCSFFWEKKSARTFFLPIGATVDLENC